MFKSIFLIIVVIFFQGCSGTMQTANETSLLGKWIVKSIKGMPVIGNSTAYIEFSNENRVSGSSSCNRFFGTFIRDDSKMTISETGSTRTICAAPLMEQERRFLSVLGNIESMTLANGSVSFKDAAGVELMNASKSLD